jgi:hypothetical protein
MLIARRKWILGLAAATVVAVAAVVAGAASANSASPSDWAISAAQATQARHALLYIATSSDPSTAVKARTAGSWPANITSGRAIGTDRVQANAAMGTPRAVSATDTQQVVCVEAHGQFSTANTPRPHGSPAQTYSYAVVCYDPSNGNITDTGFDNKPMSGTFTSNVSLDITSPVK